MDFQGAQTQADLVEVALGRDGQVSVYNARGWTQVIVDVEGWYDASNPSSGAGLYNSVTPYRVADTRPGTGTPYSGHALGPGQSLTLQIAGVDGVPTSGAEAVNINVTAVDATADSFLTVYPAGTVQPTSSVVNFVPGQAVPNQAVVELSGSGAITVTNSVGSVDVIVDLAGWYTSGTTGATTGSSFHTLVPVRVVDTRSGSGYAYSGDTLGSNGTLPISLAGLDGIPSTNVTGVVMNLTTTNATAVGNLQVWPGGESRPASSSLNWTPGETTQNLVVVGARCRRQSCHLQQLARRRRPDHRPLRLVWRQLTAWRAEHAAVNLGGLWFTGTGSRPSPGDGRPVRSLLLECLESQSP